MHAYLIMAHHNFEQLKILLSMLDDKRNNLFIHIDSKAANQMEIRKHCENIVNEAVIIWLKSENISWGGYSQVQCELNLLKLARSRYRYDYYHLLSGDDLPLSSQDEIHEFFGKNKGKNFVNLGSERYSKECEERCRYYYLFQDYIGKSEKYQHVFLKGIRRICLWVQKLAGTNRIKRNFRNIKLVHGSNWFSITDKLAEYILLNEKWIFQVFHHGSCVDELFLQTLVYNSSFVHTLYIPSFNNGCEGNKRSIYFENGIPHVWKMNDYDRLKAEKCLFARKFDMETDGEIIKKIEKDVLGKNRNL